MIHFGLLAVFFRSFRFSAEDFARSSRLPCRLSPATVKACGLYLSPRRARLRGYAETRPPRCLCWLQGWAFAAAGAAVAAAPACYRLHPRKVVRSASHAARRPCVGLLRAFYHSPRERSSRGRGERGLRGPRGHGETGRTPAAGLLGLRAARALAPRRGCSCGLFVLRPAAVRALGSGSLLRRFARAPISRQLARATLNRALPCRPQ